MNKDREGKQKLLMTEIMKAAVRLSVFLGFCTYCTNNIGPSGSAARVSVALSLRVSTVAQTGEKASRLHWETSLQTNTDKLRAGILKVVCMAFTVFCCVMSRGFVDTTAANSRQ